MKIRPGEEEARAAPPVASGRPRPEDRARPRHSPLRRARADQGGLAPASEGPRGWRRPLALLAVVGPGLIAASAGNDAGGIITYASAGAQFRYRTLFFMVLVTVAYVVAQEMTARLAVHSGKGLAALIREEFPLRIAALAMVCLVVANVGLVVTEFAGIATALGLFGVSRYISVPVAAVLIWALVLFGSYRYAERVFLILSVAFLAYPVAAFLGHPRWSQVGLQTAYPHFVASPSFILLGVALIGTTITPYIQLYTAGALVDRGVGPDEYPLERIDAVGGAIVSDVISWFIIVATAAAIGGTGPLSSAHQAARALASVAGGKGAVLLFGLGLLGASALAAAVVPLSTSYAVAEAIGVERSVSRRFSEAPLFLGLFTFQLLIGVCAVLVPGNLVHLIVNTQVLQGIITPVILAFILILANRTSVLGDAANGPVLRKVAAVVVVAIACLSAVLLVQAAVGF